MAVSTAAGTFGGVLLTLLHGAPEAAGSTPPVDWRFAAASALVVGGGGGPFYWYCGQRTAAGSHRSASRSPTLRPKAVE